MAISERRRRSGRKEIRGTNKNRKNTYIHTHILNLIRVVSFIWEINSKLKKKVAEVFKSIGIRQWI